MHELYSQVINLFEAERVRAGTEPLGEINPLTGKAGYKALEVVPKGASEEELRHFENILKLSLPSDVRTLLSISNGPAGFYGIPPVPDVRSMLRVLNLKGWLECKWLPLAHDDSGNFYVKMLDVDTYPESPVCFVESIGCEAYSVASDAMHFARFFLQQSLNRRKKWPFNRKYVLDMDPNLGKVTMPKFPWE